MTRATITPEERALIDRHLAEHGAVQCPIGAMATVPEYRYVESSKNRNATLVRMDGKSAWKNPDSGYHANAARAKRLRRASA